METKIQAGREEDTKKYPWDDVVTTQNSPGSFIELEGLAGGNDPAVVSPLNLCAVVYLDRNQGLKEEVSFLDPFWTMILTDWEDC